MPWRLARALVTLRDQVNAYAPTRDRTSDGTIGDAAHAARKSDHNPLPNGVVCALDLTDDPAHGFSAQELVDAIKDDPRVNYVIHDRRIYQGGGVRPYGGASPHTEHIHVSLVQDAALYDDADPFGYPKEDDVIDSKLVFITDPDATVLAAIASALRGSRFARSVENFGPLVKVEVRDSALADFKPIVAAHRTPATLLWSEDIPADCWKSFGRLAL